MRAVEFIVERKKRRRRPGYAAYGPGPYGGYGYHAGYSGDSGEGGGDLGEKINPKTLTRGFVQEKDMGWYTLQAVGDFASRMADEPPTMEIYAMLKPEAGKRDGKQIGQLSLKIAQGIFLKDNPGAEALVAGGVIVDAAYKRKGVASSMYQFAKELGNDVIASIDQSDDAVAMWKGMQAKGMQAKGVAEGLEQQYLWHGSRQKIPMLEPRQSVDTGGAVGSNQNAIYATSDPKVAIAMGLTTPGSDTGMFPNDPQMVLFSGKIRKGENVYLHKVPMNGPDGKPQFVQGGNSREFHSVSGVEVIKPTEIKAVPVDKYLNLIRQATQQDLELRKKYMKQGVAENFADGRNPQDKGDAKRHGVNTKANVSSLRKTAKQGGRKGQLAHWLANMKAGRAKKNK